MKGIYGSVVILALLVTACAGIDTNESNHPGTWDYASYGGADKSYDAELMKMREEIVPLFKTLSFKDEETGRTMEYSLFVPPNYDPGTAYPLVLFMADGSTVNKGPKAPLLQGCGALIWATDKSQAKHPCFVLVPSYVWPENVINEMWIRSPEVNITLRMMESVVCDYNIDRDRLYVTGQSMGGMMAFYFNAMEPDLFAASLFVGSQWNINMLDSLARKNFFNIGSAGDDKSSPGMHRLADLLLKKGVIFGYKSFSAQLPDNEKELAIRDLLAEKRGINFVQFTAGTVAPEGTDNPEPEHMYSFDYAYKLEAVRDWLFEQSRIIVGGKPNRAQGGNTQPNRKNSGLPGQTAVKEFDLTLDH